jgi:hypothetical protein
MIKVNANPKGKYYCEVCDVYALGLIDCDSHLNGRKHKEKQTVDVPEGQNDANPKGKYYCEVCDVYARCQKTYDLHLNGRKHKEKQTVDVPEGQNDLRHHQLRETQER